MFTTIINKIKATVKAAGSFIKGLFTKTEKKEESKKEEDFKITVSIIRDFAEGKAEVKHQELTPEQALYRLTDNDRIFDIELIRTADPVDKYIRSPHYVRNRKEILTHIMDYIGTDDVRILTSKPNLFTMHSAFLLTDEAAEEMVKNKELPDEELSETERRNQRIAIQINAARDSINDEELISYFRALDPTCPDGVLKATITWSRLRYKAKLERGNS